MVLVFIQFWKITEFFDDFVSAVVTNVNNKKNILSLITYIA